MTSKRTPSSKDQQVAIIGSGPAGLMAASVISRAGYSVTIFEKKSGPGKKLLIAGSSGLNITYDSPIKEFAENYKGQADFVKLLEAFAPENWLEFIHSLGIETFKGTSRRYFVEGMKASALLKAWTDSLKKNGVEILFQQECSDYQVVRSGETSEIQLTFASGKSWTGSAVCFALGGGSYEPTETPLRWPEIFKRRGLNFIPFESSNVGFQVDWPEKLIQEVEGQPLKNIILSSSKGTRSGDAVITRYGIEGTPVYFAGVLGTVHIDLKPDLSVKQVLEKLEAVKENMSSIRRAKKTLKLCPAALALLFHLAPDKLDLPRFAALIKNFPLTLKAKQPLTEAISSSGGLDFQDLGPGVFAAGEMLNWDAPTGGFWIQGCVSQGFVAGQEIVKYLGSIR